MHAPGIRPDGCGLHLDALTFAPIALIVASFPVLTATLVLLRWTVTWG